LRVKLLGAHQSETRDTRFMSLLVDGRLAIDAGGLTSTLTREEQLAIEAVLITHRHYDHIKDLPPFAHTLWETKALHIYCTRETKKALRDHIFNDVIWPALRKKVDKYYPVLFHDVQPDRPFEVVGYRVLAVEVPHTVPTVGYLVERDGASLFYTADTHDAGEPRWTALRPDLLLVETTMSSKHDEEAARFKHMTPLSLGRALRIFHQRQDYYPRVVCVHMVPQQEPQIRMELAALAQELGTDINAGYEGMEIEVKRNA
jgi:ribonuclease BN (tRNA processing enzyme)